MDWSLLASGLLETLKLSLLCSAISLALGIAVGVLRVCPLAPVAVVAEGYITYFRNTPLLIVLFFALNGLPSSSLGIRLSFFDTAVAALSIYTSAYVAEVVRGGLQALDHGQNEAARSLGLSWVGAMRFVLLPQALAEIVPPLGSVLVALTKNTALASTIAVPELLYQARLIEARTFDPNVLLIAGLLYLVVTVPMGLAVNLAESRMSGRGR